MKSASINLYWYAFAVVAFVFNFMGVVGCDIHEYVPDVNEIVSPNNSTHIFIVDGRDVQGIYGNFDVDSLIFTYITSLDEDAFWERLESTASEKGWKETLQNQYWKEFKRSAKNPNGAVDVEEVKIAFNPDTRTVLVASVEVGTSVEEEFAQEVVVPKFQSLIEKWKSAK